MANNKIQIKRSTANAVVTGLSSGELAFTQAGNVFFIGAPDGITGSIRIGGQMVPGALTANQALVANATSGIDKIIVANLQPTYIYANGVSGTANQSLISNSTGGVFWGTVLASGGADTQVQFNDGGSALNATAGFTFNKNTNNVTIANTLLVGGSINATSYTAGAIGTGAGGIVVNTTVLFVGNNTINATVNSTALNIGGNPIANSTGANNAFNLGGTDASLYQLNSTLAANVATLTANNANNLGGTAAASYQLNSTLAANVATLTANNANNLGTVAAASYVQNTDSRTLSGNLDFSGANLVISGTNTSISSNITLTGASVTGTSTDVSFRNGVFSGNLVVSGAVVTVNTQQLVVNDNIIELGLNNTTTDIVDTGFFSPAGNASAIWYSGFARIAASSTSTNPVFRVFVSNTNPNTSSTIDTSTNTITGTIQSFLQPYGSGGAFIVNSTAIAVTANSTVSVAISGNTLTLSGRSNNDLLYSNAAGGVIGLAFNTIGGYVLQSNGTAIVYDILDGGTF